MWSPSAPASRVIRASESGDGWYSTSLVSRSELHRRFCTFFEFVKMRLASPSAIRSLCCTMSRTCGPSICLPRSANSGWSHSSYALRCWWISHTTLRSCGTRYAGNFSAITMSIGCPLDSDRSSARHTAIWCTTSVAGYHLPATTTSSASWPASRRAATTDSVCVSAPPRTNGVCGWATAILTRRPRTTRPASCLTSVSSATTRSASAAVSSPNSASRRSLRRRIGRSSRNWRTFVLRRMREPDPSSGSPRGTACFSSARMSIAKSCSRSRTSEVSIRDRAEASSAQ